MPCRNFPFPRNRKIQLFPSGEYNLTFKRIQPREEYSRKKGKKEKKERGEKSKRERKGKGKRKVKIVGKGRKTKLREEETII